MKKSGAATKVQSSSLSSLGKNLGGIVDYLSPFAIPVGVLLSIKNYNITSAGVIMIGTVASSMKAVRKSKERREKGY